MDIDNDLQYLAQTDEEYADKESWLTGLKETMKHHKGMWVVQSKSSVSKAQEEYYATPEYKKQVGIITEAVKQVNTLKNKRATAILRIDVWRTLEASRRKGNIQ